MQIGIIAEDRSDVEVIKELTRSLIRRKGVGFRHFVGEGCGKLRKKCRAWADILVQKGCPWLIIVHDLDDYVEVKLREELTEALKQCRARASVVLIPCREIEAWLLYDAEAIAKTFNEKKVISLPGKPESISDPKGLLEYLIRKSYRKVYIHTKHNQLIAKNIKISKLRPSISYRRHPEFIKRIFN
jgi:hypothetical protein